MKINTFKKYKFTGELWKFQLTTDTTAQPVRNFFFDRMVTVHATTTGMGRLFVYFQASDDDLEIGQRIHVFRDAQGKLIVSGGVWEITNVEPLLNMWGFIEGFKARAELIGEDGILN